MPGLHAVQHAMFWVKSPNGSHGPVEAFADSLVAEFEETVQRLGADRIGAFIGEPVQASGGVVLPPGNYLQRIRRICLDNDILFIADEVVTAFGRLGHVFASGEVFGLDPDMITFAKGVTSGYFPLGGMIVSDRLLAELRRSNHPTAMFAHGLTYTSHPVGCAVALANLDLLENGVLEHTRAIAPYFQAQLKRLEDLPLVGGTLRMIELKNLVPSLEPRLTILYYPPGLPYLFLILFVPVLGVWWIAAGFPSEKAALAEIVGAALGRV